jgi:glucokinase
MKHLSIGIDIGGSHISCAACDLQNKAYLPGTHSENPLDNQATAEKIIKIWSETINRSLTKAGKERVLGVGFAIPGPFDYSHGIGLYKGSNKKYEGLYGLKIEDELRKSLKVPADFTVRFINDATAFALGEDWLGKTAGSHRNLALTLGTGFGSAFIENHLPVVTGNRVPEIGCLWHLPFEDGIADDYFSTRGLLSRYQKLTGEMPDGVKELAGLAANDKKAKEVFRDFGHKMGVFLLPWIGSFGVESIVLGGNISHAFPLFGSELTGFISKSHPDLEISVSELKESASIIGSAVLSDNEFFRKIEPLLAYM